MKNIENFDDGITHVVPKLKTIKDITCEEGVKYGRKIAEIKELKTKLIIPWIKDYRKYEDIFPPFDLALMEMFELKEKELK